ncbi:MAG: methyl-accepting chemotaxis protein [Desulfobacteraceae bacterium]|nr:methyl-accepting chemotaxis protein [Desulfobacteraceae bacterium]
MKISSKLILLIGLSVVMICAQFVIGGFFNARMAESMRTAARFGKVGQDFLNAVVEERNFVQNRGEESFESVIRLIKGAEEEIALLETESTLNIKDVAAFKGLLASYREQFTGLAQLMRDIQSLETGFDRTVSSFNEKAEAIGKKLTEEIGSRLVNVREVPEQFRAFQEITQQAAMLVNWSYLTFSQDLMLKNDLKTFLERNLKLTEALHTTKKNAAAIVRYVEGQEYANFVYQTVLRTINSIPGQTSRLHELWKDKMARQAELDEIRKQAMTLEAEILNESKESTDRIGNHLFMASLVAIFITVCAVFLFGFGLMRSISRPIEGLTRVAGEVAGGDLRNAAQRLGHGAGSHPGGKTREDEIGRLSTAFARMVESLQSLIGHVRTSGIQVVSSATEISASARELEASAAQQAASVNQVSVTSRQISSSSRDLVKTMGGVVTVASETAALARDGQSGLQGMEETMRRLIEATGSIASKLETISEKTNNIGSVVTTINRVADRTNLLSLNAAIEAEKAGEFGMGFSVVAREIRRLADQSAVATLDIEQMVKEMQSAVSSGVMEVDKFVQQVRHGGDVIAKIGGQLTSIIEEVHELIPRFDEVNTAMEAQSTSAEEISGAMVQLSEGAEQTKQVVSEFNRVVEQLTDAVHILQKEVSKFELESGERS